MRRLVVLLLFLGLCWMGYWAAGAITLDRSLSRWIEARQTEGWVAEVDDIAVTGFPARFAVTVSGVDLADPVTGLAWRAPTFDFVAPMTRPTEITAIWPDAQVIASPFERITVGAAKMEGTLGFAPDTGLALQSSDIALEDIALTSTLGWTAGLTSGQWVTSQSVLGDNAHRLDFTADGLRLAEPVKAALDPAGVLPDALSNVTLRADIDFTAPWDRRAIEIARPQITALELEDLNARWGTLELRAAGALTVDANGVPTGQITIKAVNWREMLGMAEATGALPAALMPTIERALELLAQLSGPPDTLDAPLSFQDGFVSFGPIPLGRAPRMIIR